MGLFRPATPGRPTKSRRCSPPPRGLAKPRVDAFLFVNQPHDWQGTRQSAGRRAAPAEPELRLQERPARRFRRLARRPRLQGGAKEVAQEGQAPRGDGPARPSPRRRPGRSRTHPRRVPRAEERAHARAGDRRPLRERASARVPRRLARGGLAEGAPRLELHALFVGDRLVATFGALSAGDRLSGLFLSHDCDPEIARSSPAN